MAMAMEAETLSRFVNPLVLNLQKMELELKCPSCLQLLDQPILLPCDHMFCSQCVVGRESNCPSCKSSFLLKDMRPAVHIRTLVNIYKDLKSALCANFLNERTEVNIIERKTPSSGSPASRNDYVNDKADECFIHDMSNRSSSIWKTCSSLFQSTISRQPGDGGNNGHTTQKNEGGMNDITEEAFVAQVEQHSPPSFGNVKDSDHDSGNQGSEHRTERSPVSDSCKRNLSNVNKLDVAESKRQKLNSKHDGECNNTTHPQIEQTHHSSYVNLSITAECMFCHSARVNEATGKMLLYLNGKEMGANQANQPNVLHVHQKCIEWAPQVYYSGDTVMNLESEISRASKIKCSRCGLKGAALGCYVSNCRRSYHIPCAYEIQDCRWDCENYLVLCPLHSSRKLPCERSKTKSKNKVIHSSSESASPSGVLTSSVTRQRPEIWTDSRNPTRNWVFCGSALSKEEKELLYKLASMSDATVTDAWNDDVTHVVASTDDRGGCSRTLKFLMAILRGKWVLNMKWVKDCIEAGHALAEECYEVTHDVHGCFDGPKRGRISYMEKAPKLFAGLSFYFSGYFVPSYKGYLVDLVLAAGSLLLKEDQLHSQESSIDALHKFFVVYSAEPPQEDADERRVEAEDYAANIGGRAVCHSWLLDAIAACRLQLDQ